MLENYSLQKEEEIRKQWAKNKIPEKARKTSSKQKKCFYFMDGPPYATGHIHMGTALNKILKDVSIRYKRMNGFNVFDRPGYDTHGTPIEFQVEKEINTKSKQDIEKFGVENFIKKCRKYATEFIDQQNNEFENLGVWMDWENPYITLKNEYIESIWWTFKKAEEKKLLYLGEYSVHVCPRCETAVSFNEIEYIKQTDNSVYIKFPLKEKQNTFLIIWTTTPWTLPA
ncbi:MAG: isoleucine--tRNA ligase, partial [Candidatus Diapherotrites archaeon CG_4_10_14_0_2_um_filter_31_5]